jgi:hypothetical protein
MGKQVAEKIKHTAVNCAVGQGQYAMTKRSEANRVGGLEWHEQFA